MAFGLSAGAVAGIGALGGALITADATSSAAGQQAGASAASTAEQGRQYDLTRSDQMPWMDAGKRALGQLETGINTPFDSSSVTLDPGYQFGLKQGQLGIDRKAAAAGGRISGAALKAAAEFGNDYATTKWSDAYNRGNQARSDRLARLAALAGIGQTSAQQVGSAGISTGQGIGNTLTAQGNASAAGTLAQGNIWGNATNQIAALYGRNSGSSTPWAPSASYGKALANSGVNGGDQIYG